MLKPSTTRRRRLIFVSGLTPIVLAAVIAVVRPGVFGRLDDLAYDVMLRSAATRAPDGRIVIVDVDDRSLSVFGQWPWRRDLVARLIDQVRESGASVIALDIIFAEPDRSGEMPDNMLAAALRRGRVVLGYGLTFDPVGTEAPCVLGPIGVALVQRTGTVDRPLFHATGAICNLPMLAEAAGASGFLNAAPDADGVLRRVPVLTELGDRIYPSLALTATAAVVHAGQFALRASTVNDSVLSIDERRVPLDARGNLLLRFRGKKRTFRYVSAADVLRGATPAGMLRDKIVFVGVTALGAHDMVTTPFDTLFPGIEVQATVADNLLQQDFVSRPAATRLIEVATVLLSGVGIAALFSGYGVVVGLPASIAAILFLWFGGVWLLSRGALISPVFPEFGIAFAVPVMTVATWAIERRRADRAGRERTAARALMVQALLSLTEVRDAETGRHSLRTQRYARLLAEELSANAAFRRYLTRDRIDLLSSLAPLHDIGKVGIPDHILNKPGALTADELVEMRRHPTLGRDVILKAEGRVGVRDDETLELAKDIVYTHHERWDGTGYPQALQGAAVPVAGRIMAVVDVYDALTTRSLYKKPISHGDAVTMILAGKGTHFDPAVVDAFLSVAPRFREVSEQALA